MPIVLERPIVFDEEGQDLIPLPKFARTGGRLPCGRSKAREAGGVSHEVKDRLRRFRPTLLPPILVLRHLQV